MTTTISPETLRFIDSSFERLCKERIDPWYNFSSKPFVVTCHDGSKLTFENKNFEGKPREDFWNAYIDPFLFDLCEEIITKTTQQATDDELAGLLRKIEIILFDAVNKVYEQMTQVDQKLLTDDGQKNVKRKSIDAEESIITDWLSARLEQCKPTKPQQKRQLAKRWYIIASAMFFLLLLLLVKTIGQAP